MEAWLSKETGRVGTAGGWLDAEGHATRERQLLEGSAVQLVLGDVRDARGRWLVGLVRHLDHILARVGDVTQVAEELDAAELGQQSPAVGRQAQRHEAHKFLAAAEEQFDLESDQRALADCNRQRAFVQMREGQWNSARGVIVDPRVRSAAR